MTIPMVTRKHFLCACARHPCERKMSILRLQEETQQKRLASFPLLRRPRPPPPRDEPVDAYDGCRETTGQSRRGQSVARGERVEVGAGGTGLQGRLATPLNPLPRHHPTPTSSHRHPFSPSSRLISKNPICEEDNNQLLCSKDITTTDFRGSIGKTNPIRGPPPFPVRKPKTSRSKRRSPKRKSDVKEREVPGIREAVNQELNGEDNEFLPLFSDLGEAEEAALYQSPQRTQLREKFLSRQNYLKLTGWFATHVPTQDTLNTMTLTGIAKDFYALCNNIILLQWITVFLMEGNRTTKCCLVSVTWWCMFHSRQRQIKQLPQDDSFFPEKGKKSCPGHDTLLSSRVLHQLSYSASRGSNLQHNALAYLTFTYPWMSA